MALFQKLTIIGFLFLLFVVIIPLCIYFYQTQQNKKRITKTNLKSTIFFYYIKLILSAVVIGIITFIWYIKVNTANQSDSHTIKPPKIETNDEWFQTKNKQKESESYYDSYRIDYSEKNKEVIQTLKASEITHLEMVGSDGSKTKIEGTPMIKRTYNFYGIAGLGRGHHQEYEPTDLPIYIKDLHPFDKWNEPLSNRPGHYFNYFHTNDKDKDSQFVNDLRVSHVNHTVGVEYKGPKYLLEEDKDFFMDEVQYPTNKEDQDGHTILNISYLHFNPVKQYLTLYTKKFNTKETEKSLKPRKRG
ncbi:MAG: hypothetical protein QS2022_5160 [Candidatus Phytoplasma asteris]|nr:MAG: hypothetical protein QS2022_5160 [Candidatus Phytoplasma asteris]